MNTELNEAAEKYANENMQHSLSFSKVKNDFKAGAQWQAEQKQVISDEEIEKLAAELLKEKDEQIKELVDALETLSKITFPWDRSDDIIIENTKSILQKHNAVTKQ